MKKISNKQLENLVDIIIDNIQIEFENTFLSGNLVETIKVERTDVGYNVIIPAEKYDINKFLKEKVVVYTGKGSYANQIDNTGGWSGKHKNYVMNIVKDSIEEWVDDEELKCEVKEN